MIALKISWPWQKTAKNEASPGRQKKRIYNRVKKVRQYHVDLEMDTLGQAVDAAKDTENPDFDDLYNIYDQIKKDRHLKSQQETAIVDIQQAPFRVVVDKKEDEELKDLFDTEWFDDSVQYFGDAEFWGHSLVEYPEVNEDQVFDECFLIPRQNVNPAKQRVILDRDSNLFLPYEGKQLALNLIEIWGKEELGLYEYLAEEVILKKYARTDWSQGSEKYGMPFLDYATDTQDKKEIDAIEEACAAFAANGYIIHGKDDDIEIKQAQNGDFYKIYMEAIKLSNEELSKSINGQTATGDTQAFVGTAEMHERIKNAFTKARLRRVQHHINGKLIPLMIKNGYKMSDRLAKAKFQYIDLLDDDPQLTTKQGEDPANPDDPKGQQQQQQPADDPKGQGKPAAKGPQKPVAAKSLLDTWLERFFNELADKEGIAIDPDIWRLNFQSLQSAMSDSGIEWTDAYQYADLAAELRTNAAAFAAFKNHDEQQELRALLVDDNGEPRSFNNFKKLAKPLTEKYNKEWLQTEFKQAQAASQMAVKWEGFKEEADLYPNLRYDAVLDADTRPDHARLDGVVRPISDPFWNRNYPPNGWGCRCSVTQTDEAPTKVPSGELPDAGFDFNPGKDRKLFSDENGYLKDLPKTDATGISREADKLLNDFLNA